MVQNHLIILKVMCIEFIYSLILLIQTLALLIVLKTLNMILNFQKCHVLVSHFICSLQIEFSYMIIWVEVSFISNVIIYQFFLPIEYYFIIWMNCSLFIHSLIIEISLVLSQVLAITNEKGVISAWCSFIVWTQVSIHWGKH